MLPAWRHVLSRRAATIKLRDAHWACAAVPTGRRMTVRLPPSRRGLSMPELVAPTQRRPALTASARTVLLQGAGRDEETVPRSNKETDEETLGDPVLSHAALLPTDGAMMLSHGVPRSTTGLTKMSNFLAQAMSATLSGFPAAVSRGWS